MKGERWAGNDASWCGLHVHGLTLLFEAAGRGGGFAGSAWRGLLGQALASRVCVRSTPACTACPLLSGCAYPSLFKPLDAEHLAPVWLHGWRQALRPAPGWRVGLRWLGDRVPALSEWLDALAYPKAGLAFGGLPARLVAAHDAATGQAVWTPGSGLARPPAVLPLVGGTPPPERCRVVFHTPLVSKHAGDPLLGALRTRVQRLIKLHGNGAELAASDRPWEATLLQDKPRIIPLARRRLKGRELQLDLAGISPEGWALLQAGVELHAGGQASLGCGHYEIMPGAALATDAGSTSAGEPL